MHCVLCSKHFPIKVVPAMQTCHSEVASGTSQRSSRCNRGWNQALGAELSLNPFRDRHVRVGSQNYSLGLTCCRTQESLFTSWTQPLQNEGLRAKELLTSTDSLQREPGHLTSYRNREQSGELLVCKRPLCLQTSAAALSRWPAGLVPTKRMAEVAEAAYRTSALLLKT